MSNLSEQTTRHSVYLEGLKTGEVAKFAPFLKDIDKSIRLRLAGTDLTSYSRTKLEKLLALVTSDLKAILSGYREALVGDSLELAAYEAGFESRSLSSVLDGFETMLPSPAQVSAAVLSSPLSVRGADGGKLLEPFIKDWTVSETKRVTGAIRQGYFEGQSTSEILKTVRGTRANKYTDGILATTNRNAATVVRTSVQHAASMARMETWKANEDIIIGYRWVATLDGRTSSQCRDLDGRFFNIGEGPMPPIHMNCRSTAVPEIDEKYGNNEAPVRASMNGPVNGKQTYYDWLKTQPRAFQEDVLGIKRSKLLRDGGLTSKRFADLNMGRNFKPLTLKEMQVKEPLAFARIED